MNNKKLEVTFAPGCFDDFEGTQEELDALIAEIKAKFEDGSFLEESIPIEDLDEDEMMEMFELMERKENKKLN